MLKNFETMDKSDLVMLLMETTVALQALQVTGKALVFFNNNGRDISKSVSLLSGAITTVEENILPNLLERTDEESCNS